MKACASPWLPRRFAKTLTSWTRRCLLIAVALGLARAVDATTTYNIADIGTLGGGFSEGIAINASGQVTGASGTPEDSATHAFLYSGGVLTDLGTLGGRDNRGLAINDSGQVTGYAQIAVGVFHPFLYSGGMLTDVGTFGGRFGLGNAINARGQVTGYCDLPSNATHAFLYSGGTLTDLGTFGGRDSRGLAINDSGQVTGFANVTSDIGPRAFLYSGSELTFIGSLGGSDSQGQAINASGEVTGYAAAHAFLYSGGMLSDLGTLGGTGSNGFAINDSGQVTGDAFTTDSATHAFLYSGGMMTDLGTLGGTNSDGLAINASGQVTGDAQTTGNAEDHAFLYSGGTMWDLNALIPPGSGLVLQRGQAINDAGQITGVGWINNEIHAFLASPTALHCGNDVVEPGEQCDGGSANGGFGSCCTATCQFEPLGTACPDDGDLCTQDLCNATGTCTHPVAPSPICVTPTVAKRARLLLQTVPPEHNRDEFRWGRGPVVPLTDFGNPGGGELTRFCVYDQTGPDSYALALRGSPSVSGGGAWKATPTGWTFKSKAGAPDGITGVTLKAGAAPGKAKVRVTAKGNPTPMAGLPLHKAPRVVAQFKTSLGKCWGATFSTAIKNTATKFKAKSE